jgi:hypothetical protein
MIETDQSETVAPTPQPPLDPGENAAVEGCIRAWNAAYHKALDDLDDDDDRYPAEQAGNKAYLAAMPRLAGFKNIRDFIACITYAAVNGAIRRDEADSFLEAAKVALTALRYEPKPAGLLPKRGPGRPRKSAITEEK